MIALGLVVLGCGADEPQDGTTTEMASSVGMTSGASASVGDTSSSTTGGADESGSTGSGGSSDGSGGSEETGALVVDYETDVQPIWNANCTCHLMGGSGEMTAPVLTLNPDMSIGNLVGVASEQSALNRIEAGAPEDSYLWLKINGTHTDVGEGDPMPQGSMLEEGELAIIEAWISGGAMP